MENPKPKRIRDKKAIDKARKSYCEYCGYSGTGQGYQVHHIQSRGAGNSKSADTQALRKVAEVKKIEMSNLG